MAIKKKVRTLSPAEYRENQKKEYASCWINSEVIFGANLFPVQESFTQKITILFLVDAADYTAERIMEVMQLWNQKYLNLKWDDVLVFQQKYAFIKNQKFIDRYKHQKIFLDTFGELFERFGSKTEPVAVLLKNGEFVSSMPLLPKFTDQIFQLELELQKSLRNDDIGLPLLAPEKFIKKNVPIEQQSFTPETVTTFGEWSGTNDLLITQKNGSILSIPFRGKHLRFVGMAHPDSREPIKALITFNEKPLNSSVQTGIIHEDSTGATTIEINKITGVYDLIQSENEIAGVLKISFINAYDNGLIFYGFKVAS